MPAKETNQRKAARNFDPDESGLPSLAYFSAAGPKTRFAQTVWTLLPQPNTPLGCVAWDKKTKARSKWGPGFLRSLMVTNIKARLLDVD